MSQRKNIRDATNKYAEERLNMKELLTSQSFLFMFGMSGLLHDSIIELTA